MALKTMSKEVMRHNQKVLDDLEEGDLIEFPRTGFSHWAVCIGNGMVVHMTGVEKSRISGQIGSTPCFTVAGQHYLNVRVQKDNFWHVVMNTKAKKNNSKDKKMRPLPKEEIVKIAKENIGPVKYNVLLNNCEHFATMCRYGKSKSDQADKFLTGSQFVGIVVISAVLVIILLGLYK